MCQPHMVSLLAHGQVWQLYFLRSPRVYRDLLNLEREAPCSPWPQPEWGVMPLTLQGHSIYFLSHFYLLILCSRKSWRIYAGGRQCSTYLFRSVCHPVEGALQQGETGNLPMDRWLCRQLSLSVYSSSSPISCSLPPGWLRQVHSWVSRIPWSRLSIY